MLREHKSKRKIEKRRGKEKEKAENESLEDGIAFAIGGSSLKNKIKQHDERGREGGREGEVKEE